MRPFSVRLSVVDLDSLVARTGHYSGGGGHDSDELYSNVAVFLLNAYRTALKFPYILDGLRR